MTCEVRTIHPVRYCLMPMFVVKASLLGLRPLPQRVTMGSKVFLSMLKHTIIFISKRDLENGADNVLFL